MKHLIIIITLAFFSFMSNAQSVTTSYVKGSNSSYCGEETYRFNFDDSYFKKVDNYDGSSISGPSSKESSGYDDRGMYYELRSPGWYLKAKGVNYYQQVEHKAHKVYYSKRGGDIIAVFEVDMDKGIESGKWYITNAGKSYFCK